MDAYAVLLISLVVLLMGISKSAFAGALGVFAVPLLMLKFSAVESITLMLPILMIADAMSVKSFWQKWDTPLLRSLIPGALVGILLANLVMDSINPGYLRTIIALICIVFAIKNIAFKQLQLELINNVRVLILCQPVRASVQPWCMLVVRRSLFIFHPLAWRKLSSSPPLRHFLPS